MQSSNSPDQVRSDIAERVSRWFGEPVMSIEDEIIELINNHLASIELPAKETKGSQIFSAGFNAAIDQCAAAIAKAKL